MSQFIWKSQFNLGIEKIDHQHKWLLKHLNRCLSSFSNVEDIFCDLKKYSEIHFAGEELLMEKFLYPQRATHKKEHEFFEERVQSLENSVLKKESQSIPRMVTFLRDWFLEHILKEDKDFANFIHLTINDEELQVMLTGEVWPDEV